MGFRHDGRHRYRELKLKAIKCEFARPDPEDFYELLRHDYVVRQWLGPFKVGAEGKINESHEIQLQPAWKQRDLSLVAFVQNSETGGDCAGIGVGVVRINGDMIAISIESDPIDFLDSLSLVNYH